MTRTTPLAARIAVAFFAIAIGLYPIAYMVAPDSIPYWSSKADYNGLPWWRLAFYAHITGGGVALLTGWTQFWPKFRARRLALHRLLGKTYVAAVLLIGAPGGLVLALVANGGFPSQLGFGVLALAWIFCTFLAYRSVRRGDIENHRAWMIRSYALTFAGVALRIWLPLFTAGFGIPFMDAYIAIAWFCWVPNLMLAEYLIRRVAGSPV